MSFNYIQDKLSRSIFWQKKLLVYFKYQLIIQICFFSTLNSQLAETTLLRPVPVVSYYEPPVSYKQSIFSEVLEENINYRLGDLLKNNSSIYIKDYGKGQLQTVSFRGTGASQTKVFWNGFVMNSPSLGQTDLSLYPAFFMDRLAINFGASSLINGSGGLGGSLQMDNYLKWKPGVSFIVSHEFASFSNHTSTVKLNFVDKKQKTSHQLKLYRHSGLNDFPFLDISKQGRPKVNQQNNEVNQEGLQYILQIGNPSKNRNAGFRTGLFYFNSNRNLPSVIGTIPKQENQWDEHFRGFMDWKINRVFRKKVYLNPRFAFIKENMIYKDSSSQLVSGSSYQSIQPQLNVSFFNNAKMKLQTVMLGNINQVMSDGFDQNKIDRHEYSALAKWEHYFEKFNYDVMLRQSMIDGELMPLTFGIGGSYKLIRDNLKTSLTFAKNFRYPTLNDLYWNPGGNQNLNPEISYNTDLGVRGYLFGYQLNYGVNGFYSVVDNWIQWLPTSSNYWSPQNIKKVHARGIEAYMGYRVNLPKNMLLKLNTNYTYTKSTSVASEIANDQSIGKQLIYVPEHKVSFDTRLVTDYFTLGYTQAFTSKVYIDATNSIYLPGYAPANVLLSSKFLFKDYSLELNLGANNIFNEPYQVVANRPLPGRNYSLTLRLGYR